MSTGKECVVRHFGGDGRPSVTLYRGDCLDILPTLGPGTVVTDPPYNIGYHYAGGGDRRSPEEYAALLRGALRPPCVVIHYAEALCDISLRLGAVPDKIVAWCYPSNTARQWRGVAWFGVRPDFTKMGQPYKNPKDRRIAARIRAGKSARLYDWWEINQVKNVGREKTGHPCQMPEAVMDRILGITDTGVVVDPFMGSGTTGAACVRAGREFVGIEREPAYFEIAERRIRAAMGLST